mgnify:CR=1 FL=1
MTPQLILAGALRKHSNSIADIEAGLGCSKACQQIVYRGTHRLELFTDNSNAQFDTPTDFHYIGLKSPRIIW